MISTILATDMGLHFDYMKKLGDLQERLQENNSIDGWNGRMLEEQTAFACSLLIKCADISNVVSLVTFLFRHNLKTDIRQPGSETRYRTAVDVYPVR